MKKILLMVVFCLWAGGVWADLQVATGTITTPTSTGNAAVTGLAFQPKLIILSSTVVSSLTQGIRSGIGVCQSSTARWTFGVSAVQGSAIGTAQGRNFKSDKCISIIETTSGGTTQVYIEGDLVSLDANGFTINWTAVQASGYPVYYTAIGGSSVTAKVGTFDSGAGTGSQSVTGVGFRPSTILIANGIGSVTEGPATSDVHSIGVGQSASETFTFGGVAAGISQIYSSQGTAEIIRRLTTGPATNTAATLTSLDADGFTVNFTTNSAAKRYGYLALSGISAKSGVFNQPGSTGNQSITGLGLTPSVVILMSRGLVSSTTNDNSNNFSFGVGVSSSSRNVVSFGNKIDSQTDNGSDGSATKVIQLLTGNNASNPTLNAEADFVSQDSGGFTINWTTVDATAREVGYWALGIATNYHVNIINNATVNNATIN